VSARLDSILYVILCRDEIDVKGVTANPVVAGVVALELAIRLTNPIQEGYNSMCA